MSFLEPYNLSEMNIIHGLMVRMVDNGLQPPDVRALVEKEFLQIRKNEEKQQKERAGIATKNRMACPECGAVVSVMRVNTNTQNQIGGGWELMFFCTNVACAYIKMTKGEK